jgi:hypothetical protein
MFQLVYVISNLCSVSIKKPLKTHEGKSKKTESRDITIDYMEEEDASPWNKKPVLDTTIKIKEINSLKRSFGLGQTELLHFVNNLEFFVGYSVPLILYLMLKKIGH